MSDVRFDGKTVIVTGAGGALGRTYSLMFASRGANVVVNDLGGSTQGEGASKSAADKVVEEIQTAGGTAVASYDSVTEMDNAQKIVQTALDTFGGVHALVNNAGILRDKSFAKMSEQDWDMVHKVHLRGAFCMTKAVWEHFREQSYGRVVNTSSAAGLYGNFGQANYSAAKMGLVGFGQTLALEGVKYDIKSNIVAPIARSRMTEELLPPEVLKMIEPETVAPLVGYLCSEECQESGQVFEVGAGRVFHVKLHRGAGFKSGAENGVASLEEIRDNWSKIMDLSELTAVNSLQESTMGFIQ
ncbi:MAG TPA: SDR family oxidoreductase [Gammaproteobacteria bacterium]|nr:SDR family oxidoreductase [Gammaproteobacteria bacterium]